jgi:hypothetical protein
MGRPEVTTVTKCKTRKVLDFRRMAALPILSPRPRIYEHETAEGIFVSLGGAKWSLYAHDGIFTRDLSEQEDRALNEELMFRSLPRGEDR